MIFQPNIDPVAVHIGPLAVRWYGLMYLIGISAGWILGRMRTRRPWAPINARQMDDLVWYLALGVLVGARVGYMLFYDFPVFMENPLRLFEVWRGGMSFHGGLIGTVIGMWWFARKEKVRFFAVTDFVAPLAPIGLFCGRIGNFINGELWGKPTTLPWGVVFRDPLAGLVPRHPSELYEALLEGVTLFTILWLWSGKKRPVRSTSGLFLIFYGLFRFLVEFVREPDIQLGYLAFGWVTMGQILSLPMILFGVWLLATAGREEPEA
ncbi:Prolipoprotein diacylglyceryl transferase [Desulfovibrio sp. X2]|uniref:prolipoprotein diacylglyceryl transferase n=1 Tax=Desulfovibrio sp. X2 TaxID=941449 RepID=UPI000358ED65|nr:prolipoprotein diacylglyceryl transferase [Desulfovibrio sp. X2]EPR41947.1 Prolipoprotein diacylglyceryl transferase [Desulfovibrio sp. X2]